MSDFASRISNRGPLHGVRDEASGFIFYLTKSISIMVAVLPTTVSLGIATYAAWLRGGTLAQRSMLVALAVVATLYVHAFPIRWRAFSVATRVVGGLLWCFGVLVVMYGQASFIVMSQWDAGNQRAASVPTAIVPSHVDAPRSRSLTAIARDMARASADLALVESRRCLGYCPTFVIRKAMLTAQLVSLDTEANEVKRREAEEDRLVAQAERDDALRTSLRADPVASQVGLWFGTTESRLELLLAVASAVVLEGAAIVGWLFASNCRGATMSRVPVVSGSRATKAVVVSGDHAVAPVSAVTTSTTELVAAECASVVATDAVSVPVKSEDDQVLDELHAEVVAGRLKRNLASIRAFKKCGQARATQLNSLYIARFGARS